MEKHHLQYQKQQLQLNSELSAVYLRYKRNKELLLLQQENTEVARQTVAIALEKYRTGSNYPSRCKKCTAKFTQYRKQLYFGTVRSKSSRTGINETKRKPD